VGSGSVPDVGKGSVGDSGVGAASVGGASVGEASVGESVGQGAKQASEKKQPHCPLLHSQISEGKHWPQQHSSPNSQVRLFSKPTQDSPVSGGDEGQVEEAGVGGPPVPGTLVGGAGVAGIPVGGASVGDPSPQALHSLKASSFSPHLSLVQQFLLAL